MVTLLPQQEVPLLNQFIKHAVLLALADLEGAYPAHAPPLKGPDSFISTYKIFKT